MTLERKKEAEKAKRPETLQVAQPASAENRTRKNSELLKEYEVGVFEFRN